MRQLARQLALLGAIATSFGCTVSVPGTFGRVCAVDDECGELACVANRCQPAAPPPELHGLSCEDAIPLEVTFDGELFLGVGEGIVAAGSAAAPSCSSGRDGGSIAFSLALDAPIVARIRVDGDLSASIAVVDGACTSELEHGCAAGAARGAKDLVLPYLEDGAKIVVSSAQIGVPFRLLVEQLRCPAGFLPDGDACVGFLSLPGPGPRVGHQINVVDDIAVVTGGVDAEAALYDPGRHSFSYVDQLAERVDHAAAVAEGHLFLVGGLNEPSNDLIELLAPNDAAFIAISIQFIFLDVLGERGTLTPMPGLTPFLYVGGSLPLRARFVPFGGECDDDSDCENVGVCLQILDNVATPAGVCGCVDEDCSHFTVATPVWNPAGAIPDAARFRRRHSACDTSLGSDAEVAIVGGFSATDTPGLPLLYLQSGDFWLDLGESEDPPIARLDAATGCVDDVMVLIGGRDIDETPLASVEVYAPQLDTVITRGQLTRARADAASVVLDRDEILVIGGDDGSGPLSSTELVSVTSGGARGGPRLPLPLSHARAAQLADGDVLVVGGVTLDDVLVTEAYLYTRIGPTIEAPELEVITRPIRLGDLCETPLVLEGTSGTLENDTFTFANNVEIRSIDASCTGFPSPGLDAFHVVNVPAGSTLEAVAGSDEADISLFAFASCALTPPCLAGRDNADAGGSEAIEYTNTTAEPMDIIVVVDGFDEPAPYPYTLTWSVTP